MEISVHTSVIEKGKNAPKWDLDLDLNGQITLEDLMRHTKFALVNISDMVLKEEQADGFDKKPRRRVDNVWDRPKELVHPFGKIEYYARQNLFEVLPKMYDAILKRSPMVTGQYKSSHYVFVNERLVARSRSELTLWLEGAKRKGFSSDVLVRFVNVMPYAYPLELQGVRSGATGKLRGAKITKPRSGVSKATGNIIKKPQGTYHFAWRAIKRFKGVGNFISFAVIPNGYNGISIKPTGPFRTHYAESNKKYAGRPYVYPSIVLDFTKKGATLQ